jgi:putative membrane protein
MAQQFLKKSALAAALVSLGVGMSVLAQPTPSTSPGSGPTPSKSTSGGPTPSTSKSGGPTPGSGMSSSDSSKSGSSKSGSLESGERKFIESAAHDGMAEVQLGQIAQQKAQSPQVKEFAGRMVTDHGKANDELKTLASNKGVQLPTDTDKSHKSKADKLNKASADKFDKDYMDDMVKEHKKDVKEFEKQAKNAKDADVRAFATKTLPVLQDHLKMAQAAQQSVKSSGKSASAGSSGASGSSGMGGSSSGASGSSGSSSKAGSSK